MPTYSETDIELIVATINRVPADVAAHAKGLEAAACWFRLGRGQPEAPRPLTRTPSQLKAQLRHISRSAQRLLKHLGVPTDELKRVQIEKAYDGPGDFEILRALSWSVNHDENPVVVATRRIGRLAEILQAIEAASKLEQWAEQSAGEVVEFGAVTVPKSHSGDAALNDWIAAMLTIYKQVTGKEPATSVGAPERDNEGVPGGPLLRFLEAAGKPLGIELTPEAWRIDYNTGRPHSAFGNQTPAAFAASLNEPGTGREAFELLRGLIDSITLTPAKGKLEIELRGDLAAILALSQAAKTKAAPQEKALQIKMVAGARNDFCYNFGSGLSPAFRYEIEDAHQFAA